jgi:transcriptional regulator with XRE-family HTH domain
MISAEQCRAARALLGWSQSDLATRADVAVSTIADFERGERSPQNKTLSDIRSVFNLEGCSFREGGVTRPPFKERMEHNERKQRREENGKQPLVDMDNHDLMTLRVTLNTELAVIKRQQSNVISKINQISNELRRRKSPGDTVDVSEHAVVRFLERVHGINVKEIRRKIREAIPPDAVRGDKFTVDGITYVIAHNGRVTTLYEEEEPSVEV